MIEDLPLILDADEAIEHLNGNVCNDAVKSYAIGIMSKDGYTNVKIRKALGIEEVYTATHFIRAGTKLSEEELQMWNENIQMVSANKQGVYPITLGHIRVLAKYEKRIRTRLLSRIMKELIDEKPISIPILKKLAEENNPSAKSDIKRLEDVMGEKLGREVFISFNKSKGSGMLKLKYYSPDDLDVLINLLGIQKDDE